MSYRKPSARKRKASGVQRLNLIPILDAVFIFIFFLLMSANFIKIFEITSDVPLISDSPPPKDQKKPLALTLEINTKSIVVKTGVPSQTKLTIGKNKEGYDLEKLHNYLVNLKKKNIDEDLVILEPLVDLEYKTLIDIMDSVRLLKKTDEALYRKGKDGLNVRLNTLFNQIVFGNIMS